MTSKQATAGLQESAPQPANEPAADQEELQSGLAHLRALLEEGGVEGARSFVKELAERWPESESVRHYSRVLAPPKVRVVPGKRGRRLDLEFAWIQEHAREYPGQWVAVYGDRLVAADADLSAVLARLRQVPEAEGALLHRIPEARH